MIKKISQIKNYPYLILFFLLLFHGIYNYIWLSQNQAPPFWEESKYLLMGLKYKDLFSQISLFNLKSFAQIGGYYPPLLPISSLILIGNSIRTMAMANIIYMAIMLFSIFKIGEIIFDRKTGLWAAFILSMFPIVFGTSRMFMLDYALTAMVTLSIYLLLLTDYFKSTKYSILYGLSLGLGMLIKNTFGAFIIGPLIYIFYKAIFGNSKEEKKKQIANLFYSLSLGSILSIPWYVLSFPFAGWKYFILGKVFLGSCRSFYYLLYIIILLLFLFIIGKVYKFNPFSKKYLKWWLLVLCFLVVLTCLINRWMVLNSLWYSIALKDQIGLFFFLILIFIIPKFLQQRAEYKYILILWIVIPYCLLNLFVKMYCRYTMPYLPAIAIILALGILEMKKTLPQGLLFSLILIFCFIQFFILSFILSYDPSNRYFKNRFMRYIISPDPSNYWMIHSPIKGNWRIDAILRWIRDDIKKDKATVGLLVDAASINYETLNYYIYLKKLPLKIESYIYKNIDDPNNFSSDYLITLENLKLEQWPWVKNQIYKLNEQLKRNSDKYIKVKEFQLPYYWDIGSDNKVHIYTKKKD